MKVIRRSCYRVIAGAKALNKKVSMFLECGMSQEKETGEVDRDQAIQDLGYCIN